MIIIWGLRVIYRTIAQGMFYCRECGGDRAYSRRTGRRFITVFFIPLIPLTAAGEHVQCATCKTRYVKDVLNSPTAASMQVAIPAGVRALVAVMLRSGDPASVPARKRAIDAVRGAGQSRYDEAALAADLARPLEAARPDAARLGAQLRSEAREWHLAETVRVALADGPLTDGERATAEMLAADLGMTRAQALGVITLTQQSAGLS
jgi:hypothetical protein